MATETLQAFFLHKRVSGETSFRVRLFTFEHGVIDALFKGGRTPKKQLHLQSFTPLWVSLDVRGGWYYVRQLECDAPPHVFVGDALFSGLYMNELIYLMLKPHDPSPVLFKSYISALQALANVSDRLSIEPILRRFERSLLSATGYEVSLRHDAQTGRQIESALCYQYKVGTGFIVSKEGISGAHILAVCDDRLDSLDVLRVAKFIMRQSINFALDGKSIKTRGLYTHQLKAMGSVS